MKTVYKFPLMDGGIIRIPVAFVARHAADQFGTHCVWLEIETNHPTVGMRVIKVPTGGNVPPDEMVPYYLGTVLDSYGTDASHYYAVRCE